MTARASRSLGALAGLALALSAFGISGPAQAAEAGPPLPDVDWSFIGPFATFDRGELQRGFQVYQESCALCHSLEFVRFRDLSALGYSTEEIKALASEATVVDGPDDEGDMFERAGLPSDPLPSPFPNAKAAAAANGGAVPPDLSLVAKSRKGGPTYLYALMTGYTDPPADFTLLDGLSYNEYFPGHQIAMPPPLSEGSVEFADGTEATVDQMAKDVSVFLMWAAEPNMEARKEMGVKVLLFLLVFTGLLYAVKKKVWARLH